MRDRLRGRRSTSIKGRSSSTTTTIRSSSTSTTRSNSKRRSSSTSRSSKGTLSSEEESFDGVRFKRNDALPTTEGPDKHNQVLGSESSVMIGKTESASVSLRLTKRVNEMVEKKMATGHKSFEKLTGDKVGLKPAKPENSVKRPFKERPALTPLKKRIELIKRAQKVEEDSSLVKRETCSPKLTR